MARHDKDLLKNTLNIEDVKKILYKLGAEYVEYNDNRDELITNTICHNISGGSHKLYYYPDDKDPIFKCYTGCSCTMDIYELVRRNFELKGLDASFSDRVDWVAEQTGKSFGFGFSVEDDYEVNENLVWLERVSKKKKIERPDADTYSDRILDVFEYGYYDRSFIEDNIDIEAMKRFEIGFYSKENRIVIPHRHPMNGKIIGLRGRALNEWEVDRYKYLPLTVQRKMYNFPTYCQLYGLWQNKKSIEKIKKIVIFESEKSVLQCETFFPDNNFSVALMGRNISQHQIDMILNLGVEEVHIAMDKMFREYGSVQEQRDKNFLLSLARRFTPYVRTYVIFDDMELVRYKNSPSDHGKDVLLKLMKNKKEVLNKE